MLELVGAVQLPVRDLAALRSRIPAGAPIGAIRPDGSFWVHDLVNHTYAAVPVELRLATAHADWLVEAGHASGDVAAAADLFEQQTLPEVLRLTGTTWRPGESGQPRMVIFNGRLSGAGGYMSVGDLQPRDVFPYSNEQPTVYINADGLRPGSSGYNLTLAHEFEHLVHAYVNPGQQGWLDEGLADLISRLVTGASSSAPRLFRSQPDVQLDAWSEQPWEAAAHYEASYLWARYLMEQGGGPEALPSLIGSGASGLETIDRYAHLIGRQDGAAGLVVDWLVANMSDPAAAGAGQFGYRGLNPGVAPTAVLSADEPYDGSVHQFAGAYLELPAEAGRLLVRAEPTVPLVPATEVRGAIYWSLRGDNVDTRLTRRFDLSGVSSATRI